MPWAREDNWSNLRKKKNIDKAVNNLILLARLLTSSYPTKPTGKLKPDLQPGNGKLQA